MSELPMDERGWPILMVDGERVCAAGNECRYQRFAGHEGALPSDEFRVDGYCSVECRDWHEREQEHGLEVAKLHARTEALEAALREVLQAPGGNLSPGSDWSTIHIPGASLASMARLLDKPEQPAEGGVA